MADNKSKQLTVHSGSIDGWAVFRPDAGPAFSGDQPGIDWLCPRCGAVLVRGACHQEQFLDVLFWCYGCDGIGASPERQPGRPVPDRAIAYPAGIFRLGSSVKLGRSGVMMIGQEAVTQYAVETGSDRSETDAKLVLTELDPEGLRGLAREAVELLGPAYVKLKAADDRGLASPTPPPSRHRLVELIDCAERAANSLESADLVFGHSGTSELDGDQVSELITTVALLRRWKNHPSLTQLIGSLVSGTEVQHTIMLLAVASYLVDVGNGVGIIEDQDGSGRIPDLWVEPTLLERLEIEIKTPQALRGPLGSPLDTEGAVEVIERQVDKAASARRGQINPDHSGIVAIGGFHLGGDALNVLEAAATEVLSRQVSRKPHLAALIVSEVSFVIEQEIELDGGSTKSMTPVMSSRSVRHPGYAGDLEVHGS